MGSYFVGDSLVFKRLVELVPIKGQLSVENERMTASIVRRRDGSLLFKTSEMVATKGAPSLFSGSDTVTFQAQTNSDGQLQSLKIIKGPLTTSPSSLLMGRIFFDKIAGPLSRMLLNSQGTLI